MDMCWNGQGTTITIQAYISAQKSNLLVVNYD
jgi:hypothetical protein